MLPKRANSRNRMNQGPNNVYVPIKDKDSGEIIKESWNPTGKQSDGSTWNLPRNVLPEGHEHYFKMKNKGDRWAECDCGFGGRVYPHNCDIIKGHIYNKNGLKVV